MGPVTALDRTVSRRELPPSDGSADEKARNAFAAAVAEHKLSLGRDQAGQGPVSHSISHIDGDPGRGFFLTPAKEGDAYTKALSGAIDNGNTDLVKRIVQELNSGLGGSFNLNNTLVDFDRTALHRAVANGTSNVLDTVKTLVDDGRIDMAKLDKEGKSAYQIAATNAPKTGSKELQDVADFLHGKMTDELRQAVVNGDAKRAGDLIKAGADPSAGLYGQGDNSKNVGILEFAAGSGQGDLVKSILGATPEKDRAALINHQWADGSTAMHAAALGGKDIYDELKKQGGDVTVKNAAGWSPEDVLDAPAERHPVTPRGIGDIIAGSLAGGAAGAAYGEAGGPIGALIGGALGAVISAWQSGTRSNPANAAPPTTSPPADGIGGTPISPPTTDPSPTTQDFVNNPIQFAGNHFIGTIGADPQSNAPPQNGDTVTFQVTPTTPGAAAGPGRPTLGGNAPGAAITVTPGGNGPNTATWLAFQGGGQDTTITVPAHPTGNDPRFVLTPAVTGCAFYAVDNHDGTITFHHRSFGDNNQGVPADGVGIGYNRPSGQDNPSPGQANVYGPQAGWDPGAMGNRANPDANGASQYANGVSPFAYYDGNQWIIQGQPFQTSGNTQEPFSQSTGQSGLGGWTIPAGPPP